MNQHAEQFRSGLLESDLKLRLNIVYAGQREVVGERAVAGDVEASANFLDLDVVHVDDFRKVLGNRLKFALQTSIADQLVSGFDRSGLALDVGEDVVDLGYVAAHVGFEFGDLVVGSFQG